MSCYSNKAMVEPVLFRVLYGAGLRVSEALSLSLADVDTRAGTLRIRDSKNGESRTVPVPGRLAATLEGYIAAAHPVADIDRPRVLRFLDWLEAERSCSTATRNQRLAVIKSFCRYTAVEQPDHLDQVTRVLAIRQKKTPAPQQGHLTGDEVKTLLAEPATASARAVRATVLLALPSDSAAPVQQL